MIDWLIDWLRNNYTSYFFLRARNCQKWKSRLHSLHDPAIPFIGEMWSKWFLSNCNWNMFKGSLAKKWIHCAATACSCFPLLRVNVTAKLWLFCVLWIIFFWKMYIFFWKSNFKMAPNWKKDYYFTYFSHFLAMSDKLSIIFECAFSCAKYEMG